MALSTTGWTGLTSLNVSASDDASLTASATTDVTLTTTDWNLAGGKIGTPANIRILPLLNPVMVAEEAFDRGGVFRADGRDELLAFAGLHRQVL